MVTRIIEGPAFNRAWLDSQKQLATVSPLSRHEVCDRCGHYVQRDRPDLIVHAIREVVMKARSTAR